VKTAIAAFIIALGIGAPAIIDNATSSGAPALEVPRPHLDPVWYEWDQVAEEDRIANPSYVAEIVIAAAPRPVTSPKHWECDAPRPLANDAVQTVRECGWR
jgi:hypothetical protein